MQLMQVLKVLEPKGIYTIQEGSSGYVHGLKATEITNPTKVGTYSQTQGYGCDDMRDITNQHYG